MIFALDSVPLVLAIAPLAVLALALLGGGVVALFVAGREGEAPPPTGTLVLEGKIGDLDVEMRQQTSDSLQWSVAREGVEQGSGAATYEQDPIADMVQFAFSLVTKTAPVTLTFVEEGAVGRFKEHGSITLSATYKTASKTWGWLVVDSVHGPIGLGEMPSRGAALLAAEQAVAAHVGVALEGVAPPELPPGPPEPEPELPGGIVLPPAPGPTAEKEAHGLKFEGCNVVAGSPFDWFPWARAQIIAAFENASGLPEPLELYDATIGVAMDDAGVVGCEPLVEGEAPMEIGEQVATTIGGTPWGDVETQIDALMLAIQDDTYLSIPPPDEILAGLLGGFLVNNQGHKERYKGWAIVVRPRANGTADWWIFAGPRHFDEDADATGHEESLLAGVSVARNKVDELTGGLVVLPEVPPEPGVVQPGEPSGILQAQGQIGDVTVDVRKIGAQYKWTIDSPAIAPKIGFANKQQLASRAALLAADSIADFGEEVNMIAEDGAWWLHIEVTGEGLWDWTRSDGANGTAAMRRDAIEEVFATGV